MLAPYTPKDAALQRASRGCARRGTPVLVELPGHEDAPGELGCDRRLVKRNGKWTIEKV